MSLDLNTTNINDILNNISCCITNLAKKELLYASTGNTLCFNSVRDQSVILDEIYNILKQNYGTSYPTSCFSSDELNSLYQIALRLCKLCNCNN